MNQFAGIENPNSQIADYRFESKAQKLCLTNPLVHSRMKALNIIRNSTENMHE